MYLILLIFVSVIKITNTLSDCGNPRIEGGNNMFETCDRFNAGNKAILITIPSILFICAAVSTYIAFSTIAKLTALQSFVNWDKNKAYTYYSEADKIYGSKLITRVEKRCDGHLPYRLICGSMRAKYNENKKEDMYLANVTFKSKSEIGDNDIPIAVSYMHCSLRTHWHASLVNIMWAFSNMLMAAIELVSDKRAGTYWSWIGIIFIILDAIHIILVVLTNTIMVPDLYASGLQRSIFENYGSFNLLAKRENLVLERVLAYEPQTQCEIFVQSDSQNFTSNNSTLSASAEPVQSRSLNSTSDCPTLHANVVEIAYLDQYEKLGHAPDYLNESEKTLFIQSYNEAIKTSKLVSKFQKSLLSGAGSSAIAALLIVASSVQSLDVNGTTPSINALSLAFTIGALAQAVSAVSYLISARVSSNAATSGIEAVNKVWAVDIPEKWAIDIVKLKPINIIVSPARSFKESKVSLSDILDPDYNLNRNIYKYADSGQIIVSTAAA